MNRLGFGPVEIGKVLGTVFMAWYSFQKLRDPSRWMFLDNVNLIFHEAGHPIFSFFGEFMMFLGGSLMQLLVPIVFTIYFWRSGQRFAAMVTTFWLATVSSTSRSTLPMLAAWNCHCLVATIPRTTGIGCSAK